MEKPGVLGCVLGQQSRLPCVGKSEGLIDATARGTHPASAGSAVAAAGDDIAAPVCGSGMCSRRKSSRTARFCVRRPFAEKRRIPAAAARSGGTELFGGGCLGRG